MSWSARFIAADDDLDGAPVLHGSVVLEPGHGAVRRATLDLTALGVVEARLNGRPVGEEVLAPGWSSYEWRLRVRRHDVTALLVDDNRLELALGNGWWRGRLGFTGVRAVYGDELAGFAQLEVEYADGHRQVAGTDETWRAGPSTTTANDLYDGQTVDAGRDTSPRVGVHVVPVDAARLTMSRTPPIRRHESLRPQRIWTAPSGGQLLDFGQNLVGWLRFTVTGPAGSTVTVRHAEVLEDGELCVRPLRSAQATDRLRLSGGPDTFEPTFTTHGFRYAEVTGWPGVIAADDVEAVVVHSDLERIGTFRCSDHRLNRLHENVVWTVRGNAVGVPTDCPQRDERLGWTGDIAVAAPAAAYLFDMGDFLADWLRDVALEQEHAGGRPPLFAPDCLKYAPAEGLPPIDVAAIWGDATVWVPWALWTAYGDDAVLREQWPSMVAYADRALGLLSARGLWEDGFQFGDWLDPQAPPDRPFESRADDGVVATACLFRSLATMARIAETIGADEAGPDWAARAAELRAAFGRHYVDAGRVQSDCPTVYALAIAFGLLDPEPTAVAGDRLAELVRADGHRIGTGFAGTPFVLDALTSTGHLDDAYALLLQTACPSWLHMVELGATTIWERWDSLLPDGSVNPGEMTSFNHYALGAVADWLHRTVGGLQPLEPGWSRVLVAPRPGGGLTWAETTHRTPYGEVRVAWRAAGGELVDLDVTVPPGVTALVQRPDGTTEEVVG